MVDLPPHAFPGPFIDRGKLRTTTGGILFGSDPHVIKVGSQWVLHQTYGSTKPGASGYPGIYQRRASSPDGPYSGGSTVGTMDLVLSPYPVSAFPDECGNETINFDKDESGNFVGIYHGYRFGNRTLRAQQSLIRITAGAELSGWTKEDVIISEDPLFGGVLVLSEPAIQHIPGTNRWDGTFNVRSTINEQTAHRVYRLWSDDDGVTWDYNPVAILVPESFEEATGGANTIGQPHLVRDARPGHATVWHMFYEHSGKIGRLLRGLKHKVALESDLDTWFDNPNGLLMGVGAIGSESESQVNTFAAWLDPVTFEWHLFFRAVNDRLLGSPTLETFGRPHIRYATSAGD